MLTETDHLPVAVSPSPPAIALAADFYNRYSSEVVTYFVHFRVPEEPGASIQLSLPKVMEVVSHQLPAGIPLSLLGSAETEDELLILLALRPPFKAGQEYEFEIQARIKTFFVDQHLQAEAILLDAGTNPLARESIQVAVHAKSEYLQYLPEIYQSDDFTSRFLMLIESFWKPISGQIEQVSNYFDPDMTPPQFLPWLSSWLGLHMDMNIPDDRIRPLLRRGVTLFQLRGTLNALQTYLEIISTGQVRIREQRASNFVLGQGSTLGVEVALGRTNQPHTVYIHMDVPETELHRLNYTPEMYQRKMAAIVRSLVPAHILFNIQCSFTTTGITKEQA